jgi:hypothetical protein
LVRNDQSDDHELQLIQKKGQVYRVKAEKTQKAGVKIIELRTNLRVNPRRHELLAFNGPDVHHEVPLATSDEHHQLLRLIIGFYQSTLFKNQVIFIIFHFHLRVNKVIVLPAQ